MDQRLENMSQEVRNPNDLHALDERVQYYTHLASRNQYLVLTIGLSWAALYQAILMTSGRFVLSVTVAISTSVVFLLVRRLWLAGLERMDERAKRQMMSSFFWASFYVCGCAYAIFLYLHLYVASSDFLDRSDLFPFLYFMLPIFLSIITKSATLHINRVGPTGTHWLFWFNVISVVLMSLIGLSNFVELVELSNVPLVFIILNPILVFLVSALLLALIVVRHERRKPSLEDE